jgi:uncharacterized membrane protein
MSSYLIVKWLHILSAVAMVGTGFGTAFYLFFAVAVLLVQLWAEEPQP